MGADVHNNNMVHKLFGVHQTGSIMFIMSSTGWHNTLVSFSLEDPCTWILEVRF